MRQSKSDFFTKNVVIWAVATICCALWGSAFPCVKIGYSLFHIVADDTFTQILFAGIRFFIAGILAIIIFSVVQRKVLVPKAHSYDKIIKLSMFQTVGQYIFFYIGLAHTTGVKASIIEAVNVFVVIIISCLVFRVESLTIGKCLGSIIGFAGVVIVNLANLDASFSLNLSGDGCIFLSTIMYAFSSVYLKKYSKEESPVVLSAYQFVVGGIILMAVGIIGGGRISEISVGAIFMLLYLAFVSAIAYSLWSVLLMYNDASKVAVFGFINPICGVILSALLLNERDSINIYCMIALALVCLGIYITNKSKV